jgi:DUF4097 and DUF4098 domain-containing protein YvlB
MPASSNLKVATVNGGIKVVGLAAQVDASSVNVGRLDQDCRFSTVNGKIVLAVAGPVNADLSASTVNGRIETDFPITAMGSLSRRSLKGRIGNGGPQLELSTVNGGIRIERLSASASM